MRFVHLGQFKRWKPLMAALVVIASCSGCASTKPPADFPKVVSTEPSLLKKAAVFVTPSISKRAHLRKAVAFVTPRISERSYLKKAVAFVTPRKKTPPLLPHQKDLAFARHQYYLQNYEVAEFYLKKTLLQFPDEPLALRLLPWTYFSQKRYNKALLAFERNHTSNPRDPDFVVGMGWCYMALNNNRQALNKFSQAEGLSSNRFYDIQKGKAIIYLKQKNLEKALPALEKIYNPGEIESILTFWKSLEKKKSVASLPVIPDKPGEPSLFTLPVEHPRYRSILWTLNQPNNEALEDAWRYYRKRFYRKALQSFQNLPEPFSYSLDAQNGLAWSYLKNKKVIKAEQIFRDISQIHPNFIGVVKGMQESENLKMRTVEYAEYYLDLGKPKIAGKRFEALTEEYPDWAYPYSQLGMLELRNDDLETANDYFQKALELEPGNEGGLKGLDELEKIRRPELYEAQQALKKGDFKEASSLYYYYIKSQKPRKKLTEPLARAYSGMGWSLFQRGQYKQAIQKFKQARKHKNYKSDAIKGIGFSYFHLGQYKYASLYLKIIHNADPDQKQISYNLDWSVMRSWKVTGAQQYFERELQKDPLRASLYMGMGWVHLKKNKPDLAVEYFLKSISLKPDSVVSEEFSKFLGSQRFGWQVYNQLGWAYYHERNFKKSKEMFQISIQEQPNKSEAHKGMGYNLYQMKKYGPAIKYLKQALAINPKPDPVMETNGDATGEGPFKTQTTVRTRLARAYFHLGNYKEAIRYYQKCLTLNPNQPDAYDGLGWVYMQLHRLTESRAAFTQAVKLEPMNRLSHKGLREVKQLLATRNIGIIKPDFPKTLVSNGPARG